MALPNLQRRDSARLRGYAESLRFYNGQQWDTRELRDRRSRQLVVNYVKTVVQKTIAYTLEGLKFHAAGGRTAEERKRARATEAALAELVRVDRAELATYDAELHASVFGDGVFKVTWDAEERRVRVAAPDPRGVFPEFRHDDRRELVRMYHRYPMKAEAASAWLGRAIAGDRDGNVTMTEHWTPRRYELWAGSAEVLGRGNPYGFIPFVVFPNTTAIGAGFGESDVQGMVELQREINRAVTQLSRILEVSGNPITVLENVDQAADIAVEPGAMWELPEKSKAYLLDLLAQGGVSVLVEYVAKLRGMLQDITETPSTVFGETSQLSGVALALTLDPMTKRVERKRLTRTPAYAARNDMMLALWARFGDRRLRPVPTAVSWNPVVPADRAAEVRDEVALVQAGIHARVTAAANLGTEEAEGEFRRWLAEERERAGRAAQPA